ncbi:MAG TPA: peptide chain release factor N(5)-glutamine methyltransferase [Haliangiales bacterium]|nr:peptide chain release factor N(5)-glutamine methyltransferase [Haliangiales bacterium]
MGEAWTPLKVLAWTTGKFAERGIGSARLDAEVLLAHALGTSRVGLYTGFDKPLQEEELAAYRELVRRRLAGEPVAYLVGQKEFWSLPLRVDPRVLIPRQDTETLVEVALRRAPSAARIADVATGSGAVALALAKERPGAMVVATDVSEDALAVARANAGALGLAVRFVAGDLLAPLAGERFDLVVGNPPYVPSGDLAGLAPEVGREPRAALDGGPDGLALVRRLVAAAPAALADGGVLALEHGFDQGEAVRALFAAAGLADVETARDLGGNERVTSGARKTLPTPPG